MKENIEQLIDMLVSSSRTMALTGAGISVESGIPDFRSPGGLWSKVDPDYVFSRETFLYRPEVFYREGLQHLHVMLNAEPNKAHKVLARLEESNLLHGVTTQNVDNLHQAAGSGYVLELHGHLRTATCMNCGNTIKWDDLIELVFAGQIPARCTECRGVFKPDAVFFGDPLPPDFEEAAGQIGGSKLLLVIGTSLEVAPVNLLPQLCSQMAVINKEPSAADDLADLVVYGNCTEVFAVLEEELESRGLLLA